jgi:hypothetical protein
MLIIQGSSGVVNRPNQPRSSEHRLIEAALLVTLFAGKLAPIRELRLLIAAPKRV